MRGVLTPIEDDSDGVATYPFKHCVESARKCVFVPDSCIVRTMNEKEVRKMPQMTTKEKI